MRVTTFLWGSWNEFLINFWGHLQESKKLTSSELPSKTAIFNLIYHFFCQSQNFSRSGHFFVVREWNASGNWKKCRKLSTTALIDDFFFISIFFHFNWQLHFRFDRIWIEAKITLGNAQSCLLIDREKMRENLLGKFLWMRNF